MLKITGQYSAEQYQALLEKSDKIYIDRSRLLESRMETKYMVGDLHSLAETELFIESCGAIRHLSPDTLKEYLDCLGIYEDRRYLTKGTGAPSLDSNKVLKPLIERGIASNILKHYINCKSYQTYNQTLTKLMSAHTEQKVNAAGRCINTYPTHIVERENLRFYYNDINVVSIPKKYSNIITTPTTEWHLAWCDYPQADWRFAYNLFIADESNREIMRSCEDAYEGLARIIEGDKFDPDVFKTSRKEYKVDVLSVFYGSKNNKPIANAMHEYFNAAPRYKEYVEKLHTLYKFKVPIPCTSYFDYTQMIPVQPYPDAFISKCLNTPIQTFTSHVVIDTLFGILEKFYSLGYTEDDIRVYYIRHDEIILMFKDTIAKDAWVFKDCSEIFIDGFTPIRLEYTFGDYYTEKNEELDRFYKNAMEQHPEKLSHYEGGQIKEYDPIPSVGKIEAEVYRHDENNTVIVFDLPDGKLMHKSTSGDVEEAFSEILPQVTGKLGHPEYLYIETRYTDFITRCEDGDKATFVKVVSTDK